MFGITSGNTKGYTINFFINLLENNDKKISNLGRLYEIVSPRFGFWATKSDKLDSWLYHATIAIAFGGGKYRKLGKYPKQRILKALKMRKDKTLLSFIEND